MPTAQITSTQSSLIQELERTPTSYIEPHAFFISWSGVLTVAYRAFTPPLAELKARITAGHPALPPEAPGSRWPKTSLGCLKDGVTLTKEQFETLNNLCK